MAITLGACGEDADTDATAPAPAAAPITQAGDARDLSGRDEAPTDAASSGAGERSKAKIGAAAGGTGAEVVERVLVDHYAHASCEELTANAERQFGYGPGPDCDTVIAERNPPKKVTVSDVTVDGAMATAVASGFTPNVFTHEMGAELLHHFPGLDYRKRSAFPTAAKAVNTRWEA